MVTKMHVVSQPSSTFILSPAAIVGASSAATATANHNLHDLRMAVYYNPPYNISTVVERLHRMLCIRRSFQWDSHPNIVYRP
mmetsp:Transcript_11780/g.21778  ORF Transcript_11780/g.21778 Transcript_11780/m.21778 type:complete len:82 (+) Transcript_11780:233-478(+)